MRRWLGLAILFVGTCLGPVTARAVNPEPTWLLSPDQPGPDLPPVGRSLFDHLMTEGAGQQKKYVIPWPFQKLLEKIQRQLPAAPALDGGAEFSEAFPFLGPLPFQPAII